MFRTKEGARRSLSRAAGILALGLCFAELGCTSTTGLRSVWPDRPMLLGFWDRRQPPPPDPADDYYARYMHAAKSRSAAPARDSRDAAASPAAEESDGEPGPPAAGDPVTADETRSPSASRPPRRDTASTGEPRSDETIRVTLGMPEPLPSATKPADVTLASARPPSSWEAEGGSSPSPAGSSGEPGRVHRAEERPESAESAPAPEPRRPATPARPKPSLQDARDILARSEAKLKSLATYQVKMSRVERVDGRLQPEEEVVLSIHRQPREVRLQWTSGPSEGREVIYSTRVDDRSLFVHMPKSAIPLPTMKMAVDSPMVMKSSRHSITEAGFDTIIDNLRKSVDQADDANTARGRAAYRGVEKPPGLDRPSHVFTRRSPNGETWTVFIDARTMLPTMVVAKDPSGQLDEKYVYREVVENPAELASADAFDPDRRWGASNGLFSRFARGGAASTSPSNSQSTMR
jgi:Protein of unknown function (DUF1571)